MYANKRTSKKKEQREREILNIVFQSNLITITDTQDSYFFEIKNKLFTEDIVEAVSYMMKNNLWRDEELWNLEVPDNVSIEPYKSLYWLSGGDEIWKNPLYNVKWADYCQAYVNEFSIDVEYSLDAMTLGDIRYNLVSTLNLDTLFEFGLKLGIF